MRCLLLVVFVLTICLRVYAHDSAEYRLLVPSAADYIERITEIAEKQGVPRDWPTRILYANLTDLAFRRFPDLNEVDFQQLLAAYDAMGIGRDGYFWSRGQWVEAIFTAWMQQTQPNFNDSNMLRFKDFQIGVTPYDFNGDDQNEYVLDVIKGQPINRHDCGYQAEYVNYLVVQSTESGYQVVETPLHWLGYGTDSSVTNFGEGGQIEINFKDINADGLPEWLVLIGGETFGGPSAGYENTGRLYILGWRDNRLIDLAALENDRGYPYSVTAYGEDASACDGPVPRDVTWEFVNLDADDSQEILQHQIYLDNWWCIARETKVINWNPVQDRYVQSDTYHDFPDDSQNCARRQAEEAMWLGNYNEALEYYEHALTLQPYIDLDESDPESAEYYQEAARNRRITYDQYHMARMALAYQLTGQSEKARTILESLRNQEFLYEPMKYFVAALLSAPDTPLGACLAAYTTFAQHYQPVSSFQIYYFGVTIEQNYGTYGDYSPTLIGCNAPLLIETTLRKAELSSDDILIDYLDELGIAIRKSLQTDLNNDGIDEWLLWPESPMNPLFFVLDATNHYEISTPAVDPFNQSEQIRLWALPDESGTAIAYLTPERARFYQEPWACAYDPVCGVGGGGVQCSPDGFWGLTLWRMDQLSLTQYEYDVCRSDFSALFPDGEGSTMIDGGEMILPEEETFNRQPISYEWESNRRAYVEITNLTRNTPIPALISTPEPQYRSYSQALDAYDYLAALPIIDETILLNEDYYRNDPDALYTHQYTRAFILESLNRPNEALAQYVDIYRIAPESAWGMMAELHFEIAES